MSVKIGNKVYNQVHERVHAVHNEEIKLECSITTEILSIEPDSDGLKEVLIKATVLFQRDGGSFAFNGHAFGKQSTNPKEPEFAKFVEKIETTADGRALAFAGLAGDDAIASAEEVRQAQEAEKQAQEQRKELDRLATLKKRAVALYKENQDSFEGMDIDYWASVKDIFKAQSQNDITIPQWERLIEMTKDVKHWEDHFTVKIELVEPENEPDGEPDF